MIVLAPKRGRHLNNWIAEGTGRANSDDNPSFWKRGFENARRLFCEFDPGSGRTLAACLTHASRTDLRVSGKRVSNAWVTCPEVGNNSSKGELIPHVLVLSRHEESSNALLEGPASD